MKIPFDRSCLRSALERMDIADIAQATIRQSGDIARTMERDTGVEFLHLEMGVPGLPPERAGVEAECAALQAGVASQYPNMFGIPELKTQASRFLKAFLDVEVAPRGCIPTVGSMQGSFTTFLLCSQLDPQRRKILFIDPGFPVQRSQVRILGIPSESFDIYDYRGEKLGPKIESVLAAGDVAAIVYSNPNNPAWICLTEDELRTIGELATRYDAIVIEDLAYLCMDFRKPLGRPFEAPYQASVARYTDNYILLVSGSKIFSYAGQRIAVRFSAASTPPCAGVTTSDGWATPTYWSFSMRPHPARAIRRSTPWRQCSARRPTANWTSWAKPRSTPGAPG